MKSERYKKIDASLPEGITPDDEVLIITGHNSRSTWHIPDSDNEPICETHTNTRSWTVKKLIVIAPTYNMCPQCYERKGLN